jgi:hypothetical protein
MDNTAFRGWSLKAYKLSNSSLYLYLSGNGRDLKLQDHNNKKENDAVFAGVRGRRSKIKGRRHPKRIRCKI